MKKIVEEIEKIDYSVELFKKIIELVDDIDGDVLCDIVKKSEKIKKCLEYMSSTDDIFNFDKFFIVNKIDLNPKDFDDFDYHDDPDGHNTSLLAFELYKLDMKRNLEINEALSKGNKK